MDDLILEQAKDGMVLKKVNGAPVHAVVPDIWQGQPVCAIGDYAFAEQSQLKSVSLPNSVASIGNHAFYNCHQLEQLTLHHGIRSVGDGAFKNCEALHYISVQGMAHINNIISDFPHEIILTMTLEDDQTAALLFPEYDYEYLENVPPREFRSVTYGSGSFYRMCVSSTAIDFDQYDQTFARAVREDACDTVQNIAFYRLLYPYHLRPAYQKNYLDYLSDHAQTAVQSALRQRNISRLELLIEHQLLPRDILEQAIALAAQMDFPEAVSLLMDHRLARFSRQRKRFEL